MDLNHRPLGYEPNELPDCSTPRHGWGGRIRTHEWQDQNLLPCHLATPQKSPILAYSCIKVKHILTLPIKAQNPPYAKSATIPLLFSKKGHLCLILLVVVRGGGGGNSRGFSGFKSLGVSVGGGEC